MNVENELIELLKELDDKINNKWSAQSHATFLLAKATVLTALQKYEGKEVDE